MSKKTHYALSMLILSNSSLFSMNTEKPIRAAIGISGTGTNMVHIVEKWQEGYFKEKLDIPVVFSSNEIAPGIDKAVDLGIANVVVTPFGLKKDRNKDCARLNEELKTKNINLIILAGFMYLLDSDFVKEYEGKILNLHPSLLPQYPGKDAIEQAFNAGEKEMGASIIFVADDINTKHGDTGHIIRQKKFNVEANDTLETVTQKMHALEYELYSEVIKLFCEGQIRVEDNKIVIDE